MLSSPATSAYAAWRDGGLTVLDVGDPTRPKLLAHRNLEPALRRRHAFAAADPRSQPPGARRRGQFRQLQQGLRHTWLFDGARAYQPVSFATMPVPSEADYCAKRRQFGPHNLWENRPGAFQKLALRLCHLSQCWRPGVRHRESVPAARGRVLRAARSRAHVRPASNRPKVIQSADCFVDAQGVMYLTDNNAGLFNVLQFEGA